ncbi:Uncharacterized protein DBV15_07130 [Temnothorax longispinosus]|uniref:Uncharacterized protein n=1 Tax=Temnothorax longispinosus TaxID=300112 RepID=A0A4S2L1R6_9HYME|nr:Uncharacterized protein DBV15_07130 [Temnothorax longispinosus]
MGGNPAMHLSIVKLSRFIRMMDRSPDRRNLAQFVTRANFVRAELARVAAVSFERRKCARKTHELHGDRIPERLLTGIPPSPVPSPRSEGPLFAFHRSRRLHRCDASSYGCKVDGKVKITDCNSKCLAMLCDETQSRFTQTIARINASRRDRVSEYFTRDIIEIVIVDAEPSEAGGVAPRHAGSNRSRSARATFQQLSKQRSLSVRRSHTGFNL